MKQNLRFSRQRRQLQHLGKQLLRFQTAGKQLPIVLTAKFRRLTKKLLPHLGANSLKRSLGAAAFFLGLTAVNAQEVSFLPIEYNPFGLQSPLIATSYYNYPAFGDLDGDGDLDLMTALYQEAPDDESNGKTFITFFENVGDAQNPVFAEGRSNPFGIDTLLDVELGMSQLVDIDGDGDLDYTSSGTSLNDDESSVLFVFENTGTADAPAFAEPQSDPLGLILPETSYNPLFYAFGDMDGDGDTDIMATGALYEEDENQFVTYFYENIDEGDGITVAAPQSNPMGIAATSEFQLINSIGDIDGDGDLDIIGSYIDFGNETYTSGVIVFENTGDETTPNFASAVKNPFGIDLIEANEITARFETADLDGDGDLDIFGFTEAGRVYFQNGTISSVRESVDNLKLEVFPNPTNGIVQLNSSENIVRIEVFDALGRNILSTSTDLLNVDLSNEVPGVYLIKAITEDNRVQLIRVQKN